MAGNVSLKVRGEGERWRSCALTSPSRTVSPSAACPPSSCCTACSRSTWRSSSRLKRPDPRCTSTVTNKLFIFYRFNFFSYTGRVIMNRIFVFVRDYVCQKGKATALDSFVKVIVLMTFNDYFNDYEALCNHWFPRYDKRHPIVIEGTPVRSSSIRVQTMLFFDGILTIEK